jgi:xylulokinase
MQQDQLYIGIDSGTQGTKAIVYSRARRKILASAYAEHPMMENNRGRREQEPAWWIQACESVIDTVLGNRFVTRSQVCAIGVSGQQHGMVALDAQDQVIRPAKLWCDTETAAQCLAITENAGGLDRVISLTGNAIAAGFTASKILWMKQKEPGNYDRLATILLPHDYINFWLSGLKRTECGDASGTAYFDVCNRRWSQEILKAIDSSGKLEACLPELIPSDEPVGVIRPAIAKRFGLPGETIVSSGGGDNMMAAIGTGNVIPGIVTTSLGTSGTIYAFSDEPVVDRRGELAAFCSSSGGWLPLVCTMNVTVSTERVRDLLGLGITALNQKASAAPPGAEGIILLPYFNGERTPALPEARASFHGLTSANTTPENFCRAAMEGATMGLRYGLDVLKRQGVATTEIRLVGGGAKSTLWRQIVADIFGCPVICPVSTEAGAMGAVIQAMWCDLKWKAEGVGLKQLTDQHVSIDPSTRALPDAGRIGLYDEIYGRYLKLNRAVQPLYT